MNSVGIKEIATQVLIKKTSTNIQQAFNKNNWNQEKSQPQKFVTCHSKRHNLAPRSADDKRRWIYANKGPLYLFTSNFLAYFRPPAF
jgi:hypothetical protein